MPHFDIIKKSSPAKSFRVASVMGTYDLQSEHISERFVGDIDLPNSWNVGLIVGRSGVGSSGGKLHNKRKKESGSSARITASFEYMG